MDIKEAKKLIEEKLDVKIVTMTKIDKGDEVNFLAETKDGGLIHLCVIDGDVFMKPVPLNNLCPIEPPLEKDFE